jgi:phosphoribosylformylglycinamidine cyclo-ligase
MCVNDVITSGAEPLFFLDYISCPKLDSLRLEQLVSGIAHGCKVSGCSLLGGETAEHGRFSKGYDPAGFCVGVVEESLVVDGRGVKLGDQIIGIASSGLHSNGYSLINDMLWRQKIKFDDTPELLTATTIYAPLVNKLLDDFPIYGMANITGGGIPENLPRCVPQKYGVKVDYNSWPIPDIFSKIMLAGEIPEEDMITTFNMGIGYCLVIPPDRVESIQDFIFKNGYKSWVIGEVVPD